MRTNSQAWLYSEESLRTLRNNIHFAPIAGKYKMLIRNMIKLLALHDIHGGDRGMMINTLDCKGNARVNRPPQAPRGDQFSVRAPRPITGMSMEAGPDPLAAETATEMMIRMRRQYGINFESTE